MGINQVVNELREEEQVKALLEDAYKEVSEDLKEKVATDALLIALQVGEWSPARHYMVFSFLAKMAKPLVNETKLKEAREVVREMIKEIERIQNENKN